MILPVVMCIMKTFHITAPHIHNMNIYHDMTSHTLLSYMPIIMKEQVSRLYNNELHVANM